MNISQVYPVTLYFARSSVEMMEVGRYDHIVFTAEHYPMKGDGRVEVNLRLIDLDDTTTMRLTNHLLFTDMQPAKAEHLLALGEQFPDLQRKFPIIALDAVWKHPDGSCYSPYLSGNSSERNLHEERHNPETIWIGGVRFLVFVQ